MTAGDVRGLTTDDLARERRRTRYWVFAAAALGLGLRLGLSLFYWVGQPLTRDEQEYLSLARSLVAGDGFVYDPEVLAGPIQPFGRAPGYPAFLAVVGGGTHVTRDVPISVKVAQSFVGTIGILLIAAMAGRLAGARAARAGAIIAAGYPPLVWIAGYAFSEALFWPVGLMVAWSIDRIASARSSGLAGVLCSGALTAVAILIRPAMLLFLPLAGSWFLMRRRYALAGMFAVGLVLVLAPWAGRNFIQHGRFVLVASEGGVTFWTGNHALATGDGDMAANPQLKLASQALRARHPQLTEEEMEPVYYREAFAWMSQHPIDWLALELRKVFYLVVPIGPSYTLHSTRYFVASLVSYGVLLPVALSGFVGLGDRRQRTPGLWLLAGSAIAASLLFFPQERFRLSIIDPALIICAATRWGLRPEEARA